MKLKVENIGVDAGMIMICDKIYYRYRDELLGQVIKVPNGRYKVNWRIRDTWNGDIKGRNEDLDVISGEIMVSDPCYQIDDNEWQDWLDKTDFGNDTREGTFIIDSMGGDGSYDLELKLEKIDE